MVYLVTYGLPGALLPGAQHSSAPMGAPGTPQVAAEGQARKTGCNATGTGSVWS